MAEEIELKLSMQPQDLSRLDALLAQWSAGEPQVQQLNNTYFDTPQRHLHQAKAALRLRSNGQGWVQTLKTSGQNQGALTQRGEWEMPVAGPQLEVHRLPDQVLQPEWYAQLQPLFTTNFTRRSWLLDLNLDAGPIQVELAADTGKVTLPNGKQDTLSELELELKAGRAEQLFALADQLASQLSLHPAVLSKAERGLRLLGELKTRPAPKLAEQTHFEVLNRLASYQLNRWIECHENWAFSAQEQEVQQAQRLLLGLQGILVVQQRLCPSAPLHQARIDVKKLLQAFSPWVAASHADRVLQLLQLTSPAAEHWRQEHLGYAARRSHYRQLWQQKWTGRASLQLTASLFQSQCLQGEFAAEQPAQLLNQARDHLRFPRQPMDAALWVQRYPALVRLQLLLEQVEPWQAQDRHLASLLLKGIEDLQGYQELLADRSLPGDLQQQLQALRQELLFNLGRWAQALGTAEPGSGRPA